MSDDLITFVIDGSRERNGAIPVAALLGKLRVFVAAMYGLDRAFSRRDKTQVELEVVGLSKNSPGQLAMRPRAKASGYDAQASTDWGFDQLVRLREGSEIDAHISEGTLDNVVDFASWRAAKLPELGILQVQRGEKILPIDETLAARAMVARQSRVQNRDRPWKSGVSHGSVFGELRGVMDFEGKIQFYIVPPSGAKQVQCTFPEKLRSDMNERLFKSVKAHGFLHYTGDSPFPSLLEADRLEGAAEPARHFSALRGLFGDLEKDEILREWA